MFRNAFMLISTGLLLAGCQHPKGPDEGQRQAIIAQVGEMLHEYHKAIAQRGLTAEFDYLDTSENFFWVPPGFTTALSYDSVKIILETNAPALKQVDFKWESLKVFPLSKRIATYTGTVQGKMVDTAGSSSSVSLIESGTVIKRPSGWKILSGQSREL